MGLSIAPGDGSQGMTRAERMELSKLARMRAKVARTQVDARAAELRADVEAQLSAEYEFGDAAWAEVTEAAKEAVRRAQQLVAAKCQERGIPTDFAPTLTIGWYGRGRNAEASRRTELRRTAASAIEAQAKSAKNTIEARSLDVQTELLAGGLTSAAAHEFLSAMPTPEALMPVINVRSLDPEALTA